MKKKSAQILKWFNSFNPPGYIYGYMYGHPTTIIGGKKERDQIISIPKGSLILSKNQDCFIYVWGWPGPDCNFYYLKDYGVTWAFTEEELK